MGRARTQPDIYECVVGFSTVIDGGEVLVPLGTRVRAGHPLLEGREQSFRLLEIQYDVEQATAAPGEKRGAKKNDKTDDE